MSDSERKPIGCGKPLLYGCGSLVAVAFLLSTCVAIVESCGDSTSSRTRATSRTDGPAASSSLMRSTAPRTPVSGGSPSTPRPAPTRIVSDRFSLRWELDGQELVLSVDTDLPDYGELVVSVSRIYYQVGEAEAYSQDYLSVFEPVSRWREPRRVSLDADEWRAKLEAEKERLRDILPFEVARVSDEIEIRAVLHLNQDDPRFGGRGNPSLSGAAVTSSPRRNLVEAETTVRFPLVGGIAPPPPAPRCPEGSTRALRGDEYLYESMPVGCIYTPDEELTVVFAPTPEPPDGRAFEWIERIRRVPPNTRFEIIGRRQDDLTNWYHVRLPAYENATGWINPIAMMNMRLASHGPDA